MGRDAILRQGDPVEDLMAFVISEVGRAADDRLEETLPLCLYFSTPEERDEFVSMVVSVKPNMRAKKIG
ncbi:MAG: hypothetical protein AB7P23_05580 [Amphiplicatus sp.]